MVPYHMSITVGLRQSKSEHFQITVETIGKETVLDQSYGFVTKWYKLPNTLLLNAIPSLYYVNVTLGSASKNSYLGEIA